MAIERINMDRCTGCGMCENFCPVDVIRFDRRIKRPVIAYPTDCMVCGLCEDRCEAQAITVTPHKKSPLLLSWG